MQHLVVVRIGLALALGLAFGVETDSRAIAGELPKLRISVGGAGGRVHKGANVVVIGEVSPSYSTQVRVRVLHVLANDLVIQQAGCSVSPSKDGKFVLSLEPPPGAWFPGLTRVVVSLGDLPQVKQADEFEFVGDAVVVPFAGTAEELPVSGLVVDLPLAEVKVFELRPEVTFLVQGNLQPKLQLEKPTGPPVYCEAVQIRDDATRVIMGSAFGTTFVQPDGTYFYQIQMRTPQKRGLFHVNLRALLPDSFEGEPFGKSEFPFSIHVKEAAEQAKP